MGASGNPARRIKDAPAQDQPGDVTFNADTFEREREGKTPFTLVLGGQRFTLREADTVDYRDLIGAYQRAEYGDIRPLLSLLVPDDQRDAFEALPLSMAAVQELMKSYRVHFGLPEPGKPLASRT